MICWNKSYIGQYLDFYISVPHLLFQFQSNEPVGKHRQVAGVSCYKKWKWFILRACSNWENVPIIFLLYAALTKVEHLP